MQGLGSLGLSDLETWKEVNNFSILPQIHPRNKKRKKDEGSLSKVMLYRTQLKRAHKVSDSRSVGLFCYVRKLCRVSKPHPG
jgi:hypothetical protein